MADRKGTLKAFNTYKLVSIGNKNLDKSLAEDIVDGINWIFDALDEIAAGRKAAVVDFNSVKAKVNQVNGYTTSLTQDVGKALDGGVTKEGGPAGKALARAIGELRKTVADLIKAVDKDFDSNKTVQADAELADRAKGYSKTFMGLVASHAEHLRDVRTLSLQLKKCMDDDDYDIDLCPFLKSGLSGHKAKGAWTEDFCDDLIKVLDTHANSDKRDKAYDGYMGKLIKVLPEFNGLFAFASDEAARKFDKYRKAADESHETIQTGCETLIPSMCNAMIRELEKKKKAIKKADKKK